MWTLYLVKLFKCDPGCVANQFQWFGTQILDCNEIFWKSEVYWHKSRIPCVFFDFLCIVFCVRTGQCKRWFRPFELVGGKITKLSNDICKESSIVWVLTSIWLMVQGLSKNINLSTWMHHFGTRSYMQEENQ